jgi:hypothetical protein
MIVYNVTIKVDRSIVSEWLEWLKKEHIPDVIGTGCFTHANTFHLFEADDEEGITYVVQYHASSPSLYNEYITQHADGMRKRSIDRWGNKFIAFRTVMHVVN